MLSMSSGPIPAPRCRMRLRNILCVRDLQRTRSQRACDGRKESCCRHSDDLQRYANMFETAQRTSAIFRKLTMLHAFYTVECRGHGLLFHNGGEPAYPEEALRPIGRTHARLPVLFFSRLFNSVSDIFGPCRLHYTRTREESHTKPSEPAKATPSSRSSCAWQESRTSTQFFLRAVALALRSPYIKR